MPMASDAASVDLRAQLEEERDSLRAQLEELGFGGSGLNYDSNFADSSQVTAEKGETEALAATLQETLTAVDAALNRMDKGTYGLCEGCGQPIADERLEALPAVRLCMTCKRQRRSR